jgi:uncharacterized membrane protein (UPF0127 family)
MMRITGISSGAARSAALLLLVGVPAAVVGYVQWHEPSHGAGQAAAAQDRLELMTAAGSKAIDIEVAATPEQQALGLMFRTSLADSKGMLFPYDEPRELTMWMKNTYIPLDMVFIRADGTVHRIEVKAEPLSERVIASDGAVTAVLELAGGAAERLGLKPGDHVRHPHFQAPVR